MDHLDHLDDLIDLDATTPPQHEPGDTFAPTRADGTSDLNLHVHDMQAEPDPAFDRYREAS